MISAMCSRFDHLDHRRLGLPVLLTLALTAANSAPAPAQGLTFTRDAQAATALARRDQRPMMFYLLDRSRRGGNELSRRHAATFRDPRVAHAAALFVCVELSIDQHPDLKRRWMLSRRIDRQVVFTTPDGDKLHQSGVGDPAGFVRNIRRAWAAYGDYEWDRGLRETIQDDDASGEALIRALQRIRKLQIRQADFDVANLLDRPSAQRELRGEVLRTLGTLSTRLTVRRLVTLAADDSDAAGALDLCAPDGAAYMAEWLGSGSQSLDATLAHAIGEICDVPNPKPPRFWQSANDARRRAEIHRLRSAARDAVMRYQEDGG